MRLLVSVVSGRDWKVKFGSSMCGLIRKLSVSGVNGQPLEAFDMQCVEGTTCSARTESLKRGLELDFTHMLSIDDDMYFSADCVDKLASHGKTFVGANYVRRNELAPVGVALDLSGKPINSWGKTGIEECDFTGMGLCLLDLQAIKQIPQPWFTMAWNAERQQIISEDVYFCRLLRANGIPVYIDHDVSRNVKHVGDFPYAFMPPKNIVTTEPIIFPIPEKVA